MSDSQIPDVIKLILPNGGELEARWPTRGHPDRTSSSYRIGCEGKDEVFRAFFATLSWGAKREALRWLASFPAADPLILPFLRIGDEQPHPVSSIINLTERQAIAVFIQSRGEHHRTASFAKRAKDMCYRCKQNFHRFEQLAPFPDFCAAMHVYSHMCANCMWVTTRDENDYGDDDNYCGVNTG